MEIGSEFLKKSNREQFFLCGRTALDAISKELKEEKNIERVLIPSYCCSSMVAPFLKNNLDVRFYDINIDSQGILRATVPEPLNNEAIYLIKYFGSSSLDGTQDSMVQNWSASIEDLTHSCFSLNFESQADYSFESYHKWFGVNGIALCRKKGEEDFIFKPESENLLFEKLRSEAFREKENYLIHHTGSKEKYLNLFSQAGQELSSNYSGFRPSLDSLVHLDEFRRKQNRVLKQRRENADFLLSHLPNNDFYRPLVHFNKTDTPLFVPITVPDNYRDPLKTFLINEEIYCPTHWPISSLHGNLHESTSRVYKEEISLVCDQRYNLNDMGRIIDALNRFYYLKA